uniref:Glycine--tRNA ligase n=1 Tax=Romanomermis culicivorax TaxID=13658 RepID=A0A915HY75_ROMCU
MRKKKLEDTEIQLAPKDTTFDRLKMEDLLKRRFFYDQSFAIYGGITGLYDYGPMGCAVKKNLLNLWRNHFVLEEGMLEVDCSILTPEPVLKASGHVDRFSDYMVKDVSTGECFRADHLIKAYAEKILADKVASEKAQSKLVDILAQLDGFSREQMQQAIREFDMKSPVTGNELTDPIAFNLMFPTSIGPTGLIQGYLRPETAQGIFVNFKRLLEFNQGRLPFAAAQIGNSFRNEISPRQGLIRVREFTMAEIEHFVDPTDKSHPKFIKVADYPMTFFSACNQMDGLPAEIKTIGEAVESKLVANQTLGYYLTRVHQFLVRVGVDPKRLRFRQHMSNEMAHYACDCWDAEILTSYGWIECVGNADRSCYDLLQHSKATGIKLVAERKLEAPKMADIVECVPNKAALGKEFKKEASFVIGHLQAMDEKECEQLEKDLSKNGHISLFLNGKDYKVTNHMLSIKRYQKKLFVEEITPSVIEPSFGIGRIMYSVFEHNFQCREGDEQRMFLSLPPIIAPLNCAILPLSNHESLLPFVDKLVDLLTQNDISIKIDDSAGSIGKRYARTDEIGIPFCVTIDFDSLKEPSTVTLRERDSMKQVRLTKNAQRANHIDHGLLAVFKLPSMEEYGYQGMAGPSVESVSLSDAIGNVSVLDEIAFPDNQPFIEAQPIPLLYRANFDTNFEDKSAFITGISKYIEEAQRHAELNELLKEGQKHAIHLYTWRCCSRAVPMPKSNEQPNRVEIYEKTVEVLKPEVQKLLDMMYFHKKAIHKFCEEVKRLCHIEARKDFISEAYLLTLGRMLNMFAILDELKNMKASIKNDYSTFRRAAQFLQVMPDSQSLAESQELSMFLATQNRIRESLRDQLMTIESHEELLADVVTICAQFYENQMYSTPTEKHMLIKILGFALYLIDSDPGNLPRLEQKKRLNVLRLDKIFKLEIVPLFGDMQIMPFAFVKKSRNYDANKWPTAGGTESALCQVNVVEQLHVIRLQHTEFVARLSKIHNEMAVYDKDGPRSDEENKDLTELALDGLRILCSWTADLLEMYSWKLLHPTDSRDNKDCPQTAEEYERATRYNYNSAEKSAIIEVVSMIKGLQALLGKMESEFSQAIRQYMYAELQDFVQICLKEPLRKSIKNKKDLIKCILQSVRETAGDFPKGYDPLEESMNKGKKEHHDSSHDVQLQRRAVPPSSTQLYMVRTMLESLLSDRSSGKKTLKKDIDGQYLMQIENFLRNSHFWPDLLNFSEILEQCCDLSQFWYREFYLEMTMGQRIQFPIDMSMPWILIDFILQSKDPALMECVLYQLDLYNDSAHYALTKFKKQFLYDEVEAEVNLCFDQFVYKLSEQILMHYKHLAGSTVLDKRFRSECTAAGFFIAAPPANRYQTIMKQRHIQTMESKNTD